MPVDRSDVPHPEGLKERRRLQELAHAGLDGLERLLSLRADAGQPLEEPLESTLTAHIDRIQADVGEHVR